MSKRMSMLDGPETSIPHFSPVCSYCRHWRLREGRTCAAFPERDAIPMQIWLGENAHQAPWPGDHGVQFEPPEGAVLPPRLTDHVPTG